MRYAVIRVNRAAILLHDRLFGNYFFFDTKIQNYSRNYTCHNQSKWPCATYEEMDSSQRPMIWLVNNRWRRNNDYYCCAGASAKQVALVRLAFSDSPNCLGEKGGDSPCSFSVSRLSLSAWELHAAQFSVPRRN